MGWLSWRIPVISSLAFAFLLCFPIWDIFVLFRKTAVLIEAFRFFVVLQSDYNTIEILSILCSHWLFFEGECKSFKCDMFFAVFCPVNKTLAKLICNFLLLTFKVVTIVTLKRENKFHLWTVFNFPLLCWVDLSSGTVTSLLVHLWQFMLHTSNYQWIEMF